MISRKGGLPLFRPIKLMVETLGFRLRSSMMRVIYVYIKYLHKIYKDQGSKGVVLRLKALQIGLMQSLGGYTPKVKASPIRFSRSGDGLPRIIPLDHRKRIRNNDGSIIRLWLSLFSLYRVIDMKSQLKLESIYGHSRFSLNPNPKSLVYSLISEEFLQSFYK